MRQPPFHLKPHRDRYRFRLFFSDVTYITVNVHDPMPLHYQLDLERPGIYEWEYIEKGPEWFRIRIGRIDGSSANA